MDKGTKKAIIEMGKMVLTGYFIMMKQAGQSKEEARELFNETEKSFLENDPKKLPEV